MKIKLLILSIISFLTVFSNPDSLKQNEVVSVAYIEGISYFNYSSKVNSATLYSYKTYDYVTLDMDKFFIDETIDYLKTKDKDLFVFDWKQNTVQYERKILYKDMSVRFILIPEIQMFYIIIQ